jgi:hypothetical protein
MVSPVVLAESRRVRLLRRAAAVVAFTAFVAGMLAAAGYPELVLLFAPYAAAGVLCATALWGLWRLHPWRLVPVAARGVGAASRATARGSAGASRVVYRTGAKAPAAWLATVAWLERPREPWRPPPAVDRTRRTAGRALDRAAPLRWDAQTTWERVAARGAADLTRLAARIRRAVQL